VEIDATPEAIQPRTPVNVRIRRGGVQIDSFEALTAIETRLECAILRAGGLLPLILRNMQPSASDSDHLGRR
jgi:aconitate hydratase